MDASICAEKELGARLVRQSALARLHVRNAECELVQGAAAFVEMWRHLPTLAWITPFLSSRIAIRFLDLLYGVFLTIRQLWHN